MSGPPEGHRRWTAITSSPADASVERPRAAPHETSPASSAAREDDGRSEGLAAAGSATVIGPKTRGPRPGVFVGIDEAPGPVWCDPTWASPHGDPYREVLTDRFARGRM